MTIKQRQKQDSNYLKVWRFKNRLEQLTENYKYHLINLNNIKYLSLRHNIKTQIKTTIKYLKENIINDYIIIIFNNRITNIVINNKIKLNIKLYKYLNIKGYKHIFFTKDYEGNYYLKEDNFTIYPMKNYKDLAYTQIMEYLNLYKIKNITDKNIKIIYSRNKQKQ